MSAPVEYRQQVEASRLGSSFTEWESVMEQLIHTAARIPWNKGKLVGQKAPIKLKDIWAIRVRLQIGNRTRELAPGFIGSACTRTIIRNAVPSHTRRTYGRVGVVVASLVVGFSVWSAQPATAIRVAVEDPAPNTQSAASTGASLFSTRRGASGADRLLGTSTYRQQRTPKPCKVDLSSTS